MNLPDESSANDLAEQMVSACGKHNYLVFAEICGDLKDNLSLRHSVSKILIMFVSGNDFGKADAALNALMFSGMAWEFNTAGCLVRIAMDKFTQVELQALAKSEATRLEGEKKCKLAAADLGLLRGMLYVAIRLGVRKRNGVCRFRASRTCHDIVSYKGCKMEPSKFLINTDGIEIGATNKSQ